MFAYQNWRDEIRANLIGCELYRALFSIYRREYSSFFRNAFRRNEHPAIVALDFAALVEAD